MRPNEVLVIITAERIKERVFDCLYFSYFSLIMSEILHDLFLFKGHQCGTVKLLINTLDQGHYTLHVHANLACFPRGVHWTERFGY